jgi:hypothetical protein
MHVLPHALPLEHILQQALVCGALRPVEWFPGLEVIPAQPDARAKDHQHKGNVAERFQRRPLTGNAARAPLTTG